MRNSTRNSIAHAYPTAIIVVCLLLGLWAQGCSSSPTSPTWEDPSPFAFEAGDMTAPLEVTGPGCSSTAAVGYGYCRKRAGEAAQDVIVLHAPIVECTLEPCRVVRIFYPTGEPALERVFAPGKSRLEVAWRELLGSETFEVDQVGYWPVILSWRYRGPDNLEHKARADGEIRLRVYRGTYVPLVGPSSPEVSWRWESDGRHLELTTAGRAYIAGAPSR